MKLPGVNPEGRLLAARGEHVREVHEDALRGFGAEVVQARLVVDDPEVGLDQTRERAGFGVLALRAAVGARHVGQPVLGGATLARLEVLDEVVGAEPLVALQALDEGIREGRDVPGCLPHALGQDDRGIEAHHVARTKVCHH